MLLGKREHHPPLKKTYKGSSGKSEEHKGALGHIDLNMGYLGRAV
jgi:hypothetical protein